MKIVTIDGLCEAKGHPTECTEPAPGTVQSTKSHNITNTDASDTTREIATVDSADMHFDSHAHDHNSTNGCHDNQSHDIDPDSNKLPNITINDSPIYVVNNPVTSDPVTGGDVNIVDAGFNNTMEQT